MSWPHSPATKREKLFEFVPVDDVAVNRDHNMKMWITQCMRLCVMSGSIRRSSERSDRFHVDHKVPLTAGGLFGLID